MQEYIANMADELYEIDRSGTVIRRSKLDLPGNTSPADSASSIEAKEEASTSEQSQTPSSSSILPLMADPAVKDMDVYKTYLRSMGLGNAVAFLFLGSAFAVAFKFPGKVEGFIEISPTLIIFQTFGFSGGPMTPPRAVADILPGTGSGYMPACSASRCCC